MGWHRAGWGGGGLDVGWAGVVLRGVVDSDARSVMILGLVGWEMRGEVGEACYVLLLLCMDETSRQALSGTYTRPDAKVFLEPTPSVTNGDSFSDLG